MSYKELLFFWSGIVWIPYSMLLFYLFYEHQIRHRYPQNFILLMFALGASARCLWFMLVYQHPNMVELQVLNRLSILLQFSAITILVLMWSRALKIANLADRVDRSSAYRISRGRRVKSSRSEKSSGSLRSLDSGSTMDKGIDSSNHSGRTRPFMQDGSSKPSGRVKNMRSINEKLLQELSVDERQRKYKIIAVVVNAVVWLAILLSLLGNKLWYSINIIMLSLLCMIEAFVTLGTGVRTGYVLYQELTPVYISNSSAEAQQKHDKTVATKHNAGRKSFNRFSSALRGSEAQPKENGRTVGLSLPSTEHTTNWFANYIGWCFVESFFFVVDSILNCGYSVYLACKEVVLLFQFLFGKRHSEPTLGLQVQREVLRTLISVSSIVCFFFLLRSFSFLYRPIVEDGAGETEGEDIVGDGTYPYFFYQLPEFFPNLAVALGISPPNGILRTFMVGGCTSSVCFKTVKSILCGKETEKASGRKSRRDISQAGKSRDNSSDYYSEYNSNYDGEYSDDELDMDEDDIRFVRTTCDALYISNTNHDSRASDVGKEKAKDIEMGQQIENIKIPTHVLSNETDQDQSFSYEDPSDYGYSSEDKGRISEPTPSSSQTVSSSGRVGKFSSEQLPMMRHREMQQFLYRINSFSSSRPSGSAKMPVARDSNNSVLSMDVGHRKSSNASPDASARKVNRNRESHSERESTASSVKDDKESTENPMRAVEMSSLSHT